MASTKRVKVSYYTDIYEYLYTKMHLIVIKKNNNILFCV